MTLIKLEESGSVSIGLADVFNTVTSSGGKAVREIEFLCDFCHGELSGWVIDAINADGSESNGGTNFVTEDFTGRVSLVGVYEGTRDDPMAVECLTVGQMGP